ncbi:MAG: DUF1501 domain-containing protein [Acetobacteraceae bacterium]
MPHPGPPPHRTAGSPAAGNPSGHLTRRSALFGLAAAFTLGRASLAFADAPTEHRFVVILLRGALDGLGAVVPYGDPSLAGLRGALLPPAPGQDGGMLELGGFYGLHPALGSLHAMYRDGEALVAHAVAGPTRERSHFEAQDCLESGADHRLASGWLNRAVAAIPGGKALAVGVSVPLLLRGPAAVGNWAPHGAAALDSDLYARIAALNAGDDLLGPAVAAGLRERGFSAAAMAGDEAGRNRSAFPALARAAGELLRAPDGPRIAALEIGGWDTHSAQGVRLAGALRQFDTGLAALRTGLGEAWRQTVVIAMTEFGRTVRLNGTGGTDHGTASVAFLAGGAVAGGRVLADWPGLGPGRLLEDRDLQPTADLRALVKGVLAQHLGVPGPALAAIFPDGGAAAVAGLVRA